MPRTLDGGVKLYSRGEWGAKGQYNTPLGRVEKDIKHHFWRPDVPANATIAQEMSVMRGVEAYHISKGWRRISYNFVVFQSGRVYEGCGLHQMGAHTIGQNSVAKAVCYAFDGDAHSATVAAKMATRAIRRYMVVKRSLTRTAIVRGHRDYSAKSCPGNKIYPHLKDLTFGIISLVEDDMAFEINRKSRPYQIKNFQKQNNKLLEKKMLKVSNAGETKAQIAEDGDWGPFTEAAWKVVAGNYPFIVYTEGRIDGHDWVEMRLRAGL